MSIDKRDLKRHKKRIQLRYGLEGPDKIGFTEDISDTGIFIKSPLVVNPGKTIYVEFRLQDNSSILVKGRVMWAKRVPQSLLRKVKGGMGIHILSFEQGEEQYRQLCEGLIR
jgi:Tfp pilus assembly protein PilZ